MKRAIVAALAVIGVLGLVAAANAATHTKTVHTLCVGIQGGGGVSRYDLNLRGKLERVCITGKRGETGKTGARGQTGVRGETGAPGETGSPGEAGPQGPRGYTGPAGADGSNGVNGTDGADGANGADGSSVTARVVEGGIAIYQDGEFVGLLTNGQNGADGTNGTDGTVTGTVAVCASPGGNLKLCGGDEGHDPVGFLALTN